MQFGAATIREQHLFRSARVQAEKNQWKSEHKHKDSVLVLTEKVASEVIAKSFQACV